MASSYIDLFGRFAVCLVCIRFLVWALKPLYQYLVNRNVIVWKPSPNNWAVITGGTDGIGLAYCKELAQLGYPLVIVSRSEDKLLRVADKIRQEYPQCPEVRTIVFDFSQNNDQLYENLEEELNQLEGSIDVLINNVGVSFKTADYFTVISNTSPSLFSSMINVNVVSAVRMTKMVWTPMIQRNRGVILNIGSISALSPVPLLALYSATKAFVDYFSQALAIEAKEHDGVIVQSVLPGFVSTKMSHLRPSLRVPTAKDYVRSALARVGHSTRTYGYWFHSMLGILYEIMAHFIGQNFNSWLAFVELRKLRARYYRIKRMPDTFNNPSIESAKKTH